MDIVQKLLAIGVLKIQSGSSDMFLRLELNHLRYAAKEEKMIETLLKRFPMVVQLERTRFVLDETDTGPETPRETFLSILGAGEPVYKHDCHACVFLGRYHSHDLYICQPGEPVGTIIARHGNEGPDYGSGMEFGARPMRSGTDFDRVMRTAYLIAHDLGMVPPR